MDVKTSDSIEWELLRKPIILTNLSKTTYIPHPEEVEILRDEVYGISLKCSGKRRGFAGSPPARKVPLGRSINGEDIIGWRVKSRATYHGKVTIFGAFQRHLLRRGDGSFESSGDARNNAIRLRKRVAYLNEICDRTFNVAKVKPQIFKITKERADDEFASKIARISSLICQSYSMKVTALKKINN